MTDKLIVAPVGLAELKELTEFKREQAAPAKKLKRCPLPCCNPALDEGKRARELSDIVGGNVREYMGLPRDEGVKRAREEGA